MIEVILQFINSYNLLIFVFCVVTIIRLKQKKRSVVLANLFVGSLLFFIITETGLFFNQVFIDTKFIMARWVLEFYSLIDKVMNIFIIHFTRFYPFIIILENSLYLYNDTYIRICICLSLIRLEVDSNLYTFFQQVSDNLAYIYNLLRRKLSSISFVYRC